MAMLAKTLDTSELYKRKQQSVQPSLPTGGVHEIGYGGNSSRNHANPHHRFPEQLATSRLRLPTLNVYSAGVK